MTRSLTTRLKALALVLSTLTVAVAAGFGCQPPVSDDATITIRGRVLNEDGSPAADQQVNLYKSALPIFESDALIGVTVATGVPFKTTPTGADGSYEIVLNGAEANTDSQKTAAFFGITTTRGADRQLGVASYDFQFSNQDLEETLPDMQFWDVGAATVEGDQINFTWTAPPTPPRNGTVHPLIAGVWIDAVEGERYSLSTLTLPFEGDAHAVQFLALSDDLRYRTSLKALTASNPRGPGLDYVQADNQNISGTDCEGKNLFDLNDGIFDGDNGVERFGQSTIEGAKCVILTLAEPTALADIVIHNGGIQAFDKATVTVQARPGLDGEWTDLDSLAGPQTDFDSYYRHVTGLDVTARQVKLQLSGDGAARFTRLGEVTLYAKIADGQ